MPPKIILHAGTPKTGTTSLQFFFDTQREAMLDRGVLYPRFEVTPPPEAKHQWMVGGLMGDDPTNFTTKLYQCLNEMRADTHTVLLSSEGLFHRWWDFSPAALAALKDLSRQFPIELWVFFREPVSFTRSFYIQLLKNPQGGLPVYGKDISLMDLLTDPWFSTQLDYIGYLNDVETHLGPGSVRPFRYDGDTTGAILAALAITDLETGDLAENRSMGAVGVDLLRRINRISLDVDLKIQAVSLVEQLNALVDGAATPMRLGPDVVELILQLAGPSLIALDKTLALSENGWPVGQTTM